MARVITFVFVLAISLPLAASNVSSVFQFTLPPIPTHSDHPNWAEKGYIQSEEVEQIIQEEMPRLDNLAGFKTPVRLTDGDSSRADPDNTISISRPQLKQIKGRVAAPQFRQMLRFLLAHEKTHQVQYRMYSVAAVRVDDPERQRLYEAQADILAGEYVMETMGKPTEDDMPTIVDTLKLAFDMGTLEYTDLNHPSKEERRTAARLGMASGIITTLSRLPPDPVLAGMISSLAAKIDILPGETIMDWSYRLSKKITKYSRMSSRDIILADSKIDWDTRAENPFVTFSLTYKNTGQRTIHVDMEVQCASVSREDTNDTLEWQKWSVKNFRFDLKPGQYYVASGRLPWYADRRLMPRLVFAPANTALISTEFAR